MNANLVTLCLIEEEEDLIQLLLLLSTKRDEISDIYETRHQEGYFGNPC